MLLHSRVMAVGEAEGWRSGGEVWLGFGSGFVSYGWVGINQVNCDFDFTVWLYLKFKFVWFVQ